MLIRNFETCLVYLETFATILKLSCSVILESHHKANYCVIKIEPHF